MRKYEKPSISVMNLQLKEDIAAATDVSLFKGNANNTPSATLVQMALSQEGTGITKAQGGGFVVLS